jgi:hypothetical protein
MQETAASIGNEQHIDIPAAEKETREPQDAFSRYLTLDGQRAGTATLHWSVSACD